MKAKLMGLLETMFIWTVGPVLLFLFSPNPKVKRARRVTVAGTGVIAVAWWSGFVLWALGALVSLVPDSVLGQDLNDAERATLTRVLLQTVDRGSFTHQHTERMLARVDRFAAAEQAPVGPVRAAVILHDALKDYLPKVSPKDRFCMHAETGAINALRALRLLEERTPWFNIVAADAIHRHMDPCGYNADWRDKRWLSKQCDRRYAHPVSRTSKVVHDLDMLDHLTVDRLVEVADQRLQAPGRKESLKQILKTSKDSAWKEVVDAGQTLYTRSARACGRQMQRYTITFIKQVDYRNVTTVDTLRRAIDAFRAAHPEPSCWAAPSTAELAAPSLELDGVGEEPVEMPDERDP